MYRRPVRGGGDYDVFLSYSRADSAAAQALCARLKETGLSAFLDRYGLPAGQPWQPWLERQLATSGALVVLVGSLGFGEWQHREIQLGLDRQASAAKAGERFPVIPVLLPGLANDALPVGTFLSLNTWVDLRNGMDETESLQRLVAGVQGAAIDKTAADKLLAGLSPYRGLLGFREQDAGLFFGRERFIDELLRKVSKRSATNVVALVGRSGSGKSSTVYAGLFPALRRERGGGGQAVWQIVHLRPNAEPLHELARAFDPPSDDLGAMDVRAALNKRANLFRDRQVALVDLVRDRLRNDPGSTRLLLYVDQWEELYTLAAAAPREPKTDEDKARAGDAKLFIDLVLEAAAKSDCTLVLSVRSDFYPDLQSHDGLRIAVQESQVSLGTMNEAELRDVIEGPPKALGASVDSELTKRLIRDIGLDPTSGRSDEYDIGKLPLLEYALEQAWAKRTGPRIGLAHYSGLEQALEERANALYGRLSAEDQAAAKRLFVSLVTPGEGRDDTRARIDMPDDAAMRRVIQTFAGGEARLVVTDEAGGRRSVEVSHEALIRHWDKLGIWIDENRGKLRTREFLKANRVEWLKHGNDPTLLNLPRLYVEAARNLRDQPGDVVIDDVKDYIESLLDHERKEREEQRRNHNSRFLLASAVTVALAASVAGYAYLAYLGAVDRLNKAELARKLAETRPIYMLASEALSSDGPVTAILLESMALHSGLEEDPESEHLLLRSLHELRMQRIFTGAHPGMVSSIAYSPSGDVLVSSDPNGLLFSDPKDGRVLERINLSDLAQGVVSPLYGVQWRPGHQGVAAYSREKVILIAPCSRKSLKRHFAACAETSEDLVEVLGDFKDDRVGAAKFSADGKWMATGGFGAPLRLWDVTAPSARKVATLDTVVIAWPNAFAISSDGQTIAAGAGQSTAEIGLFETSAPKGSPTILSTGFLHGSVVAIAFNPADSRMLAVSASDGSIFIWEDWHLAGEPVKLDKTRGSAFQIAFGYDGTYLVAAGDDGTLRMWSTKEGKAGSRWRQIGELRGHRSPAFAIAVSPDGEQIASGSADGSIITWSRHSAFRQDVTPVGPATGDSGSAFDKSFCSQGLPLPPNHEDVAGCALSLNGRVVVAFKGGRIEVFGKDAKSFFEVDDYQLPPDVVAIRLESDGIIVESHSGERTKWPFFDSLGALMERSLDHLPYDGNTRARVTLPKELRCSIIVVQATGDCAPNAPSSLLEQR